MEWLWSLTDSFVICFCSLFWTWPYTTFISISIILNLLTYKNIALIEHGQGTSKIKWSTVVFIFDFTSFHNRCPLLTGDLKGTGSRFGACSFIKMLFFCRDLLYRLCKQCDHVIMMSKNQSAHSPGSHLITWCANSCKLINHEIKPSGQQ